MLVPESWALRGLRWSYAAYIASASVQTFFGAWAGRGHGHDTHIVLAISGVEIAGIGCFLFEKAEIVGVVLLLAVYALAGLLSIAHGEVPLRFVYYAATASYLVLAGRTGRNLRGAA